MKYFQSHATHFQHTHIWSTRIDSYRYSEQRRLWRFRDRVFEVTHVANSFFLAVGPKVAILMATNTEIQKKKNMTKLLDIWLGFDLGSHWRFSWEIRIKSIEWRGETRSKSESLWPTSYVSVGLNTGTGTVKEMSHMAEPMCFTIQANQINAVETSCDMFVQY